MSNILGIESALDRTVELDADSLVYRIGGIVDMMGEGRDFASKLLDKSIGYIYEDTGCTRCNIYLGTETNYRKEIATLKVYKGNRKKMTRPVFYDAIRARMIMEYDAKLVYEQEAEDQVGIASYEYDSYDSFMIGAIDKDLDMLAGWRYNYATRKSYFINKHDAIRAFYVQLLTGDGVDNIPGLYHQLLLDGEDELAHKFRYSRYKSKLIKELSECCTESQMFDAVLQRYKDNGQLYKHGISRLIEVGRLLWIRRTDKELWVPPTERDYDYINNDTRSE